MKNRAKSLYWTHLVYNSLSLARWKAWHAYRDSIISSG